MSLGIVSVGKPGTGRFGSVMLAITSALLTLFVPLSAFAQAAASGAHAGPAGHAAAGAAHHSGGEANLIVPHLDDPTIANFMGGNSPVKSPSTSAKA